MTPTNPSQTALLLCDLQNDFISEGGAYHRAGLGTPAIAALPDRLAPLAHRLRAAGGWIVSTHFTMVPMRGGEPHISPHLRAVRPFLKKGDFHPGAWGHALVDTLAPADMSVEKIAFSAFYQTRLEWLLARADIRHLWIAGIVTNGGVTSTARDAHVRDYDVTILEDGCAAFDPAIHETAIASLRSVAHVHQIAEAHATLAPLP